MPAWRAAAAPASINLTGPPCAAAGKDAPRGALPRPMRPIRYHGRTMSDAFICDGVRTPIGRYGGTLAAVRADDLAAIPIRSLLARNPKLDPAEIDEVV